MVVVLIPLIYLSWKALEKKQKKIFNKKSIVDKAHNEYLQIAVTIGIPALLTYLTLIGIILFKSVRLSKSASFLIPLNIALISYLIQAFFNISVVSVAPLYWALLGVICSYINELRHPSLATTPAGCAKIEL